MNWAWIQYQTKNIRLYFLVQIIPPPQCFCYLRGRNKNLSVVQSLRPHGTHLLPLICEVLQSQLTKMQPCLGFLFAMVFLCLLTRRIQNRAAAKAKAKKAFSKNLQSTYKSSSGNFQFSSSWIQSICIPKQLVNRSYDL